MELISNLSDKDLIKVDVKKNEKGFMEDIVLLDGFYNKLKMLIINEVSEEKEAEVNSSSIYEVIEKEFGRTLSPIEYEIIKAWTESNFSDEIIKEAVKEAVFNGVSNLKYIDKILSEWGKKGITTVKDVEENRKKRKSSMNSKEKDDDIDMDIVDWDIVRLLLE
jgi:DNA replication protein